MVQTRKLTLIGTAPPVIPPRPATQSPRQGMTAIFTVGTSANGSLFYQWRLDNGSFQTHLSDGGNVSGSTTGTLTITNVSPANVGAYSVVVSNSAGVVTSSDAFLSIIPWRPILTLQPVSQTVLPGQTVTLTAAAVGDQPLYYLWQQNGVNLAHCRNISGSATSALTIQNATAANAGTDTVIVTNAQGSTPTSNAVLTVPSVTTAGTTMATLHSFSSGSDGSNPNGLLQGPDGNF